MSASGSARFRNGRFAACGCVAALAGLLFADGGCQKQAVRPGKVESKMAQNAQVLERLSEVEDSTLLRATQEDVVQQSYRVLARMSWQGIALRAPAAADLRRDITVPVVVAGSMDGRRERDANMGDNAILVSTRVGAAGHWVTPVFPRLVKKVPQPAGRRPPPPDESEAAESAGVTAVQYLDLKDHRALPWEPGTYALRVLCWDWVSNTATITLSDQKAPRKPPEQLKAWTAAMGEADALPHYLRTESSPQLEGNGVALNIVAPAKKGDPITVHGAVRVAVPAGIGGTRSLPGVVVLVRRNILTPVLLDIEVPVAAGEGAATGYFAFDLIKLAKESPEPAQYQLYCIFGEHTAGPYGVKVE